MQVFQHCGCNCLCYIQCNVWFFLSMSTSHSISTSVLWRVWNCDDVTFFGHFGRKHQFLPFWVTFFPGHPQLVYLQKFGLKFEINCCKIFYPCNCNVAMSASHKKREVEINFAIRMKEVNIDLALRMKKVDIDPATRMRKVVVVISKLFICENLV